MYDDLVKRLRDISNSDCNIKSNYIGLTMIQAADAIEELSGFVQEAERDRDEYRERLDKANDAIEVLSKPRWIPVTEALPESVDDDVLVTDGEGCAVGFWREDAKAWDSTDFGWLENRSEPPCGIHTVTHWMPLPEPPKEEE